MSIFINELLIGILVIDALLLVVVLTFLIIKMAKDA